MRSAPQHSRKQVGPITWLACLWCVASAARVHAEPPSDKAAVQGLGPDAQLVGGGGFPFAKAMDNYFLARARIGLLYAREPWIGNLGMTLEAGGLAQLGIGGELELNGPHRLFGSVGLARVDAGAWMTHATVGWLVFGLEWQHRFDADLPRDAMMFHVRLPLGTWWLMQRQQRAEDRSTRARAAAARAAAAPLRPQVVMPVHPAAPMQEQPAEPAIASQHEPDQSVHDAVKASLEDAARAREQSDFTAEALALARAYTLLPHPGILLQLSAAEEQRGQWLLAAADLRRVVAARELSAEERTLAEQRLAGLQAKLPHLRLTLTGADGSEQVLLDGVIEASALAGYDAPIDPGEHTLVVQRGMRPVAKRDFHATSGELVRVELAMPALH